MAGHLLIVVPIIHTYTDMGSIRGRVPFSKKCGEVAVSYWEKVFNYLKNWSGDFSKLKVYQDGLLDTEPEVVKRIVAETQSENYEVLRWLKNQGASILGTEGPALLEEYRCLQAIAKAPDEISKQAALAEYRRKSPWLLEDRDKYIANRINSTLGEEETGLLFLGVKHDVASYLDQEIRINQPETLINSLKEALLEIESETRRVFIGKERI